MDTHMIEKQGITPEQFLKIGDKIRKTNEDDTPFAVVHDDKISVIGDANKTEIKKNNYTIKFRFPKELLDEIPAGAEMVGPYYVVTVEYKDVTITPRKDLKIVASIMTMEPLINKLKEDGSVDKLTDAEAISILANAGDAVILALYNVVATFLDIPDDVGEYMLPFSVINALCGIIDTHPEVFNEADVFFG